METINHKIGNSTLSMDDDSLTIVIPRSYWTKKNWNRLAMIVDDLKESGFDWVYAPSTIESVASTEEKPAPRWKQISIDALSCIMFIMFVTTSSRRLYKLYHAIDWGKIDEISADVYRNGKLGAPAYAPQMLFRVLVLMYLSGTAFESSTLDRLATDISWRWFVGLSLFSSVPDAGTLSNFRRRLGPELFEKILIELIKQCDEAGLIGHQESYYDMTGVSASATQMTPYQRAVILAKAISLYLDEKEGGVAVISQNQIAAIALEVLQEKHPSLKKVAPEQIAHSQEKLDEKLSQPDKNEPKWWQRVTEKVDNLRQKVTETTQSTVEQLSEIAQQLLPDLPQTFGNPDATVGHTKTNGTMCGYRSGFLVDAKCRIITAIVFVSLCKPEAPTLITALDKHFEIFHFYPKRLGTDSAFDRDEVHRATLERQIENVATPRTPPGPKGVHRVDLFVWNDEGELVCPAGETMEKVAGPYKNGTERYQCMADCSECDQFEDCLTVKQREKEPPKRQLTTNTSAHKRAQQNRERSRSDEGKDIRKQRFASEGLWGHLNTHHNGDKAPYRNQEMDNIAQIMVAYTSNLEQLAGLI